MQLADLPLPTQHRLDLLLADVRSGRHPKAIAGLSELVDAFPTYVNGRLFLGNALRLSGEFAEAHACYAAALELAPQHPGLLLGLAWVALKQARFEDASELARTASADVFYGGEALGVLAQSREAMSKESAADTYLAAFRRNPKEEWLRAYCRLVNRPFELEPAPDWPLSLPERFELYDTIFTQLMRVAEEKNLGNNVRPERPCGLSAHPLRWTSYWLDQQQVDAVAVYQALLARGGICDCLVLLNAAAEDDDATPYFFTARVRGPAAKSAWSKGRSGGLIRGEAPPALNSELAKGTPIFARFQDGELICPPQRTSDALLSTFFKAVRQESDPELCLLVAAPEGRTAVDYVEVSGSHVQRSSYKEPTPVHGRIDAADVDALLGTFAAPHDSAAAPASLAVARSDEHQILTTRQGQWHLCGRDGRSSSLGVLASQLVVDRAAQRWAWLSPSGRRNALYLEDRARGERRCLERDFFSSIAISSDGDRLFYARREQIFERDIASGRERCLGPGQHVHPSPDGRYLAVTGNPHAVATKSHIRLIERTSGNTLTSFKGQHPVWSPDGRWLAYLVFEGYLRVHLYGIETARGRLLIESEKSDSPSFTDDGQHVVLRAVTKQHRSEPDNQGRFRVTEDEKLVRVGVDGSSPEVLLAYDESHLQIVAPRVHPSENAVAFLTGPTKERRLALWQDGEVARLSDEGFMPRCWI